MGHTPEVEASETDAGNTVLTAARHQKGDITITAVVICEHKSEPRTALLSVRIEYIYQFCVKGDNGICMLSFSVS